MAVRWRFRQYVTNWDEVPFRDWYWAQDPHVQVGFDIMRGILMDVDDWTRRRKLFRVLTGPHAPLAEMKFHADDVDVRGKTIRKRRIRPIGLYRPGPEHRDYILFGGAEEDGNGRYIPDDGFDRALRLWRDFSQGIGDCDDLD